MFNAALTRDCRRGRRCSRWKGEGEHRAALGARADLRATALGFHDLGHDGEAQPRTMSGRRLATPEALEDPLAILWRHAWTAIADLDAAVRSRAHNALAAGWPLCDGLLHEIANGIVDRVSVAPDHDRLLGTREGQRPRLRQRPRCHVANDLARHVVEVDRAGNVG